MSQNNTTTNPDDGNEVIQKKLEWVDRQLTLSESERRELYFEKELYKDVIVKLAIKLVGLDRKD